MSDAGDPGVVWIASYPKSGNTWTRCLIAALLNGGRAVELNDLHAVIPNCGIRAWIEDAIGTDSEYLTWRELQEARAFGAHRAAGASSGCIKVHDRYDARLVRPEITRGIVYIVRDPRDVAPSWAAHMAVDLDTAIARMGKPALAMARPSHYRDQATQLLGTWSDHVASWLDGADRPLLLVRYEDMMADAQRETGRLARFLDLDASDDRIARAVAACRFESLRSAEARGFIERPSGMDRFFRQGRSGAWRNALTEAQAQRIVDDHGTVMQRLGYL